VRTKYYVKDVIRGLKKPDIEQLPQPDYKKICGGRKIFLAVEDMKRHMTDEGWQIAEALEYNDYTLCGHDLYGDRRIPVLLNQIDPSVVVVQDKREWDVRPGNFRNPDARFLNTEHLATRKDIFKLTILKDSHQNPEYHRQAAEEIGCHAWITYYHQDIVSHLAPYTRPQHLIRTYHSINKDIVPEFNVLRKNKSLLSGAMSHHYPLRSLIKNNLLNNRASTTIDLLQHPGYHRDGSNTPGFLDMLNHYKVAVCTSSVYGYALRKLIEATVCGCLVLTDLPHDEVLPGIDDNLIRVHPQTSYMKILEIVKDLYEEYDYDRQRYFANVAKELYDFRVQGKELASRIKDLRECY